MLSGLSRFSIPDIPSATYSHILILVRQIATREPGVCWLIQARKQQTQKAFQTVAN